MIFQQLWKNSETSRTLSGWARLCLFWVHNHSPCPQGPWIQWGRLVSVASVSPACLCPAKMVGRDFLAEIGLKIDVQKKRIPYPGSPANFENQWIPLAWDEFNMKHHAKSPRLLGFDNTSSSTFSGPLCAPVDDKTVSFYSATVVSKLQWGFTLQFFQLIIPFNLTNYLLFN